HPNDAGHAEMAYTIVPSLFDALENGKPAPEWVGGRGVQLSKRKFRDQSIAFSPENIVHPFTTMVEVKVKGRGVLLRMTRAATGTAEVADAWDVSTVSVNDEGRLVYSSPGSGVITGTSRVSDGRWHKIIVTHYYAKGITMLYADGRLQGTLNEQLNTMDLKIGGTGIPRKATWRNWLFYRSGMNPDEIGALAEGTLLRSSLALYAPISSNGSATGLLSNLAQSMNGLRSEH